uniref:Uncharacterized protein n=1 Tax=Mucochytrium quahogii TaxID=96639 RepID=A0A7S2WAR9_9STRA|mmetsp:Transcript_19837/g.32598  ORF Transcript_19837/g.32598 Transcript_19837/m.32598 type:complete len:461 (+) Transcript_19837:134-1516(+)
MASFVPRSENELVRRVVHLERQLADRDEEIDRIFKLGRCIDLTAGDRELLTGERAKALLDTIDKGATGVVFGTKSFGAEASIVAADVLGALEALEHADLADIIAGRPEEEALEVLKKICGALPKETLKSLDLSENALGEKGIRALEPVLKSLDALREITFMNNGLSELSVRLLSDCLPVARLKKLEFHNNMSGPGGAIAAAEIVKSCPVLEEFRMSSSRVNAEGGLALIKALCGKGETLTKINLSDSMFDDECTNELVKGLHNLPNLTDLILRDTGLDKIEILQVLSVQNEAVPYLRILDLSGFELEEDDAELVGLLIKNRTRLRHLWLDDNELGSEGVVKMCLAGTSTPRPSMLETLSLETNQIGQRGAVAVTKWALAHPTVKSVNLNDNQIAATAVELICKLLKTNKGQHEMSVTMLNNEDDLDEDEDIETEEQASDLLAQSDDLDALTSELEKHLNI